MFVTSNVLTLPPGLMKLSESESLFWGENPFPNFILTYKHLIQTNIADQLDFFIGLFSCVLVAKSHCSCSEETSSELCRPLSRRASGTSGLFHPAPSQLFFFYGSVEPAVASFCFCHNKRNGNLLPKTNLKDPSVLPA